MDMDDETQTNKDSDNKIVDLKGWKASRVLLDEHAEESKEDTARNIESILRTLYQSFPEQFGIADPEGISKEELIKLKTVVACLDDVLSNAFSCHAVIVDDEVWGRVSSIRSHIMELERWVKERL